MVSGFSGYKSMTNLRKGNRVTMEKLLVRTTTTVQSTSDLPDNGSIRLIVQVRSIKRIALYLLLER